MESQQRSQGFWQEKIGIHFNRECGIKVIVTFISILLLLWVGAHWAEAGESDLSADKSDDDYSFNWLDPDKKIYVLQNRKYLKGGHALISVMGGVGLSNPYRSTLNIDPRLAYYLNETWGIEAFYTVISNSENNTAKALTATGNGAIPAIREIRAQYGAMLHYVPWYAKINVFNSILYFDWYFGAGAGTVSTFVNDPLAKVSSVLTQQDLFAIFVSTGHQYHITQHFMVRVDVTGVFYQGQTLNTSGEKTWYSNYNVGAGIGWRL